MKKLIIAISLLSVLSFTAEARDLGNRPQSIYNDRGELRYDNVYGSGQLRKPNQHNHNYNYNYNSYRGN